MRLEQAITYWNTMGFLPEGTRKKLADAGLIEFYRGRWDVTRGGVEAGLTGSDVCGEPFNEYERREASFGEGP